MQLFRQIETLFRTGTAGGLTDAQLLERFVQQRDDAAEAAFAALVDRHGGMVLRVCRHVLGNDHDAQDASQATFLVLARRAGSLGRHDSIGCWLHGVALRVAAKARVAAARRRAHEQQGAAMAASQTTEGHSTTPEDRERWTFLHEELGQLPEAFRAPLVLCYFEGLTQEQAAAQLNAPLGTIQSRLARGRAKLKARLERRGVDASTAIPGAAFGGLPSPAPAAWAEATVRLAMRFTHGSAAKGAARCMSASLAEKVLRAMMIGKIKLVGGMLVFATFLAVGAMTWARQDGKTTSPTATVKTAPPPAKPQEAPPPQPEPARHVTRTVHGIVRDEQGRPVAKAWVGPWVEPMTDLWLTIISPDRIRVASKPNFDPKGNAIPPGPLGKFFEYRDDTGKWQPVPPDDIRRRDPRYIVLPDELADAEKGQPDGLLEVRLAKGRQRMSRLFSGAPTAPRTDSQGRFAVEIYFSLPDFPADQLHVASPDFRHQALQVVRADGPDQPLEITLKPTRSVRARVVETPKDYPRTPLSWQVYSVDPTGTNAYDIYAISGKGALWSSGSIFPEDRVPAGGKRQLEVQLSAGHYKVVLDTFTTYRVIDLVVPEGEGPLELPEIDLANFAWVKMLGRPAAEIEATDLEGRPVKLADHRGKVVLLTFGVAWDDPSRVKALDRLVEFHKRFKDQPLSIFMLHDASISSAEALKRADGPFFDRYFKLPDTPFVLLLDRPPVGNGTGPIERRAGESESGRTSDRYEVVAPSTFVIDKQGRLASALVENLQGVRTFAIGKDGELVQEFEDDSGREPESENFMHMFSIEKLVASLEDQLGLPRTPRPKRPPRPSSPFDSEPPGTAPRPPDGPVVVTGKVIDPDGKPVAGAMVLPSRNTPEKEVKTDPTGAFSFTIDDLRGGLSLKLEAPGLATRTFWIHRVGEGKSQVPFDVTKWSIEPSGLIGRPLLMGQGAVVTGRVVRDGKPVSGISMILKFRDDLPDIEAKTDDQGHFRMARVATGQEPEQAIYSKPGSLPDHQTVIPRTFKAGLDGATVDLGDFEVQPGRTLAGRVIVSDGKPLDRHAKVMVQRDNLPEFSAVMDEAGRFEIKGIPDGHVSIYMMGITGYRLSPRNKCLDPTNPNHLAGMIIRDITDLTILIQPGLAPERGTLTTDELDPALVADFEDAKAGPIMGIAPGEAPKNQ